MAGARYHRIYALLWVIGGSILGCAEGEALDPSLGAHTPTGAAGDPGLGGEGTGSSGASVGASGTNAEAGGNAGAATGSGGSASTAGSAGAGGGSAGSPGVGDAGGKGSGGIGGGGGNSGGGSSGSNNNGGSASGAGGMDASVGSGGAAGAPVDASTEPPPSCVTCALKVQYQCRQDGASIDQASFILNVLNTGTMPIAVGSITIRYYYTVDSAAAQVAECDYAAVGCDHVSFNFKTVTPAKPKADRYLEMALSGTASIAPGAASGEIQIRLHDSAFQALYNQTNDYSFASTGAIYVDAPTIPAYSGTTKVWGTEP